MLRIAVAKDYDLTSYVIPQLWVLPWVVEALASLFKATQVAPTLKSYIFFGREIMFDCKTPFIVAMIDANKAGVQEDETNNEIPFGPNP